MKPLQRKRNGILRSRWPLNLFIPLGKRSSELWGTILSQENLHLPKRHKETQESEYNAGWLTSKVCLQISTMYPLCSVFFVPLKNKEKISSHHSAVISSPVSTGLVNHPVLGLNSTNKAGNIVYGLLKVQLIACWNIQRLPDKSTR